jgi:hypothetical protein
MATQEITGSTIEKGTDFSVSFFIDSFDGKPLNMSDYTAVAKIRKYPTSVSYKSFDTAVLGETGYINISMKKEITQQLSAGRNYFDIILTNQYETIKLVKGSMIVEETASL